MEADQLVPHRQPLLVIDRLTEFGGERDVVESTIPRDTIFTRDDGSIEPLVLVEAIAQAFAVVKGYEDLSGGEPVRKGFLVEVKACTFYGTAYGGDTLRITINRVGGTDDFSLADGKVIRGADVLLTGRVMVWIPKEA
jgi:3-hydroxyacyl-[acyl-carrier-protein] dehydratase